MTGVNTLLVIAVFVGAVLAPASARADGFVIPWVGGNAGSRNASGVIDVGATVGVTAASVIDVDVDLGYSPDFFGNSLNKIQDS